MLTAAHCITGNPIASTRHWDKRLKKFLLKYPWYIRVSIGDHHLKDDKFKYVTVSKIILHPELYDVAIFTLSQRILQFNKKISPICLPDNDGSKDYSSETAQVTGWGVNVNNFKEPKPYESPASFDYFEETASLVNELQVANVTIISDERCDEIAHEHSTKEKFLERFDEEMCTQEQGSTCQGDSGGPLFLRESHQIQRARTETEIR